MRPEPEKLDRREAWIVDAASAGQRLDVFVAGHLPDLSRARVQHLIRDGCVTVNGRLQKSGVAVRAGETIAIAIPPASTDVPASEALPLTVLYSDADIAVVDKPAGMVVHPSAGHADGTLVNALLHHLDDLSGVGGQARPGIVHRLDKGTSGVMVIAKHDRAHHALSQQFHDRQVLKEYLALVWGKPREGETFDRAIGRDPEESEEDLEPRRPRACGDDGHRQRGAVRRRLAGQSHESAPDGRTKFACTSARPASRWSPTRCTAASASICRPRSSPSAASSDHSCTRIVSSSRIRPTAA